MITTTKNEILDTIIINGIEYKLNPSDKQIQVVTDFNDYLDSLDAEIYNKALEIFSKEWDLKDFSDHYESKYLTEDELNDLINYINIFKASVKEAAQLRILEIVSNYIDDSIGNDCILKRALDSVKEAINFYELNGLTDDQEFIDFEDELNALSVKEHPENIHDWINYKKYKGCLLEAEHND